MPKNLTLNTDEIRNRIEEIDRNLEASYRAADYAAGYDFELGPEVLHPCVIDNCNENAASMGLAWGTSEYFEEVYQQLLGELDAAGYDNTGTPRVRQ